MVEAAGPKDETIEDDLVPLVYVSFQCGKSVTSLSVLSRKSVSCDLECTCRIHKKLKTPNAFLKFLFLYLLPMNILKSIFSCYVFFAEPLIQCIPNGNEFGNLGRCEGCLPPWHLGGQCGRIAKSILNREAKNNTQNQLKQKHMKSFKRCFACM